MDVVITYVNGNDPLWQQDYAAAVGGRALTKRFRDWGTLIYVFRGIAEHMPYVRKVHLVVSRESQVPSWVDRSKVQVVTHSDFIPADKLPLFNSGAIETFLHLIPGLDEEFVYFNDDFFPVRDTLESDFFREGKAAASFHRAVFRGNMYKRHCQLSDALARKASHLPPRVVYRRPQHACGALLRSVCEELYEKEKDDLLAHVFPLRVMDNYNYYLYVDYAFYQGRTFGRKVSNKHFSTAVASIAGVCSFLKHPTADFVCINDVEMPEEKYEAYRDALLSCFGSILPEKSPYEL